MADTCTCPTNSNIACSGSFGLSVYQPTCQIIPDGTRVDNPFYDSDNNITYFSYGVTTLCGEFPPVGEVGFIEFFFVPVCENIPLSAVLGVDQVLDACPDFTAVSFDFNNSGGPPAPPGFQFLRIIVNSSFDAGGSGIYRIALAGNYPAETTSANIKFAVDTTTRLATLGATQPFTFSGCPAIPRVTVIKSCETVISNNEATINYTVDVDNTGEVELTDVMFIDTVSFDGVDITLGTITVNPGTINVDTSMQGLIVLTGDLGNLPVGGSVQITYSVPIVSYMVPGTFVFSNMAIARATEAEGSAECMAEVEVVAFTTDNCCDVNMGSTTFEPSLASVGNSPNSSITLSSVMTIPNGITIQLTSTTCTATFDDDMPVPLDTDITGENINFSCQSLVTTGSTMTYPITISLISIDDFAASDLDIVLSITDLELQNPDDQILLSVEPLPNPETLNIMRMLVCET